MGRVYEFNILGELILFLLIILSILYAMYMWETIEERRKIVRALQRRIGILEDKLKIMEDNDEKAHS